MTPSKQKSSNQLSWRGLSRSATRSLNWERIGGIASVIVTRLIFGIFILLTIAYLSHLGLEIARGLDFRSALGLGIVKTFETFGRIIRGDLGLSPAASSTLNPLPVAEVVPQMLARSLGLLGTSLIVASAIGLVLGIWSAERRHSGKSLIILLISIIGVSIPSFLAATLLQMGVIRLTKLVGKTLLPVGGFGWDTHLILPVLVLAARPIAQIARVTFVSINEVLSEDFVRTAHGKGIPQRRVMSLHVMRNVAVPIATTIGTSLRFSLSSLPVVEFFFGWAGIGFYLLKAIARQDDNLTVILVLCLGVLFILVNLILDVIYRIFDPRLREIKTQIDKGDKRSLLKRLRNQRAILRDLLAHNAFTRWRERRRAAPSSDPFQAISQTRSPQTDQDFDLGHERSARPWLPTVLRNIPFLLGIFLVSVLIIVALFGHGLAPHSPYATQGLKVEEGVLSIPPFEPDETYPWGTDVLGRDIMSLVLTGAWQTLRLAGMVVLARMLVGFILGAIAGWMSGGWVDRVILGLAEIVSAFPALLLAMIFILALGIRKGFSPFVLALCFVGWGEVMQYVRSQVMTMRPKTFIESAVAVGVRTPQIITKHVLPNLIPALISLTALEMGAVLMLLGELGFVGIFIGGGAFAELAIDMPPYHYSDVPEWSALLSNVRRYTYSYPWTALYPAGAFFIAILGFNLFGEGIRRLVDDLGVRVTRIVNRYTLTFALVGVILVGWLHGSTGAIAVYMEQAENFSGARAFATIEMLSTPGIQGRSIGTMGMDMTADWIAEQFQSLGLQAAGEDFTYFQNRSRGFETLDSIPILAIDDGGAGLEYHQDYAEFPGAFRNMGRAVGPVRFLALGEHNRSYYFGHPILDVKDFTGEVLLVLDSEQAGFVERVPRGGVLVVVDDPEMLKRSYTLSSVDPTWRIYGSDRRSGQDTATLWISEATANRLLSDTGYTVKDLRSMREGLVQGELVEIPTDVVVAMEVQGTVQEKLNVRHVIGHLPGTYGQVGHQLDDHLIVVLAQYDNPPVDPDKGPYSGSNDNASGVAVMLEAIRVMQETAYVPAKTFLFIAYSGEGREGGSLVSRPEIAKFLQAKHGFSFVFEIEAVIELRGLGAGEGKGLVLLTGGSLRLTNLFKDVARRLRVPTVLAEEVLDIRVIFDPGSSRDSGEEAPRIGLSWEGWEDSSRMAMDTIEAISAEKLEDAGRTLSLALMILGRETQY